MSKVYVVQVPLRKFNGVTKPAFDLTPARDFGELVTLLGPGAVPFNAPPIIDELHSKLQTFSDDDWLLCLGSPVLIGWATAIAAHHNKGRVGSLQWDGLRRAYKPIRACLSLDSWLLQAAER